MPEKYITSQRPTDKCIKTDERVISLYDNKLSVKALVAELLFRQLILEQDNLGRIEASPTELKGNVLPLHPITLKHISEAADLIHEKGLAFRYDVDGHIYLQLLGSARRQDMKGNMRRASALPDPPKDGFRQWLKLKRGCVDTSMNMYLHVYTCMSEKEKEKEKEVNSLSLLAKFFEKNSVALSEFDFEEMGRYAPLCKTEWVEYAISESIRLGKISWPYLRKILDNCIDLRAIPSRNGGTGNGNNGNGRPQGHPAQGESRSGKGQKQPPVIGAGHIQPK